MVAPAGLEPARPYGQQIFLPLRLSPPKKFVVWTISSPSFETLGAARLVSTPSFRFQKAWLGIAS